MSEEIFVRFARKPFRYDEIEAAEPVEDAVPEDEAPHHVAARVVEARDARRRDGRHALEEGIDRIHQDAGEQSKGRSH